MKPCCSARSSTWARRVGRLFSWLLPGVVLALMPKCPACLAAYVALGTGIGLSLPVAANLRLGAIVLCTIVLGALALRLGWRCVRRSRAGTEPGAERVLHPAR